MFVCQSLNQSVNMTHTNNGIIITGNGHSSHQFEFSLRLFDMREENVCHITTYPCTTRSEVSVRLNEHGIDTTIKTFHGLGRSCSCLRISSPLLFCYVASNMKLQLEQEEFKMNARYETVLMMPMTWLCKKKYKSHRFGGT